MSELNFFFLEKNSLELKFIFKNFEKDENKMREFFEKFYPNTLFISLLSDIESEKINKKDVSFINCLKDGIYMSRKNNCILQKKTEKTVGYLWNGQSVEMVELGKILYSKDFEINCNKDKVCDNVEQKLEEIFENNKVCDEGKDKVCDNVEQKLEEIFENNKVCDEEKDKVCDKKQFILNNISEKINAFFQNKQSQEKGEEEKRQEEMKILTELYDLIFENQEYFKNNENFKKMVVRKLFEFKPKLHKEDKFDIAKYKFIFPDVDNFDRNDLD